MSVVETDIPSQPNDDDIQPGNSQATSSTSRRQGRGFELSLQMKHFEVFIP